MNLFEGDKFGYYSSTNPIGASLASVKSVLETLGIIYAVVVLLMRMYAPFTVNETAIIIEQVLIYVIFVYEFTMAVVGSVKAIIDPDKKVMGIVTTAFFGIIVVGLIVMACFKDKILFNLYVDKGNLSVSEWITLVMTLYLVGTPLVMLPLDIVSTFLYWDEIEL